MVVFSLAVSLVNNLAIRLKKSKMWLPSWIGICCQLKSSGCCRWWSWTCSDQFWSNALEMFYAVEISSKRSVWSNLDIFFVQLIWNVSFYIRWPTKHINHGAPQIVQMKSFPYQLLTEIYIELSRSIVGPKQLVNHVKYRLTYTAY